MDILPLNGCYRRKVRIFKDDDREYTIRWFIVPDCTPVLPFWTLFGSGRWSNYRGIPSQGPGELLESPLKWDKGLPPLTDRDFRGKVEWYQEGVPISALNP